MELKAYVNMLIDSSHSYVDKPTMGYVEHNRKKPWDWIARTSRAAEAIQPPASAAKPRDDVEWRKIRARVLHDRPWCEQPDCFLPATDIQPVSALSNNVVSVCRFPHPAIPRTH
ncbi:MAG: hypothetical protein QOH48_355 [Actinomycetota bacterium]|nr:hypothetical protein [Actinomycetota bacterium]